MIPCGIDEYMGQTVESHTQDPYRGSKRLLSDIDITLAKREGESKCRVMGNVAMHLFIIFTEHYSSHITHYSCSTPASLLSPPSNPLPPFSLPFFNIPSFP